MCAKDSLTAGRWLVMSAPPVLLTGRPASSACQGSSGQGRCVSHFCGPRSEQGPAAEALDEHSLKE